MQTRIIPLEDKQAWNDVMLKADSYDFYHCNSYHELEHIGEPWLFLVENKEDFIALPLITRSIPDSEYVDVTSVYGYPGPISNKVCHELSTELIRYFQKELLACLESKKVVSAFSRLHPIIEQVDFLDGLGEIAYFNKTVAINLTEPVDIQRRKYRKSNKSEINQLRNRGYVVRIATEQQQLNEFIAIYNENMRRVNAGAYYFFDQDYFSKFLCSSDFTADLLLAYYEDEITAGAIFTVTNRIMQYHLAGTKKRYLKATPMKLIIDEARLLGTERGLQYLHLGGGVSGSDEDSLYRFKSGFSDTNFTYKVWKMVVNEHKYQELVEAKSAKKELNHNYFPLYRG